MPGHPLVTVVVPVRDRRALLRRTLDALAAQTYRDFEVVVVDDGSHDGSADEARADARCGRPVRVVRGPGTGAVAARTAGVAASQARYLAFTDSDCVPDPGWLAAGVDALEHGADVVQGVTRPTRPPRPLERTVWSTTDDGLYATCNVFYRRAAFDAAGGFDGDTGARLGFRSGATRRLGFGEDTLLGWRVRRAGRAAFRPDAIVLHAVLPPDVRDAARRAWLAGAFPSLVREVPELRTALLRAGFLLGHPSRLGLYAGGVAVLARRPHLAALVALPWVAHHVTSVVRAGTPPTRLPLVAAADLALDAVAAGALVAGSARARTLVL